jgi:serine/threonine protein kinase
MMPRIRVEANRSLLYFCNLDARKTLSTRITWPYLIRIAINLCGVFEAVHSQGHIIGDINETNFLVSDVAGVTLMDCDSIQVQDNATGARYRRVLGNVEFTAPELQGEFGEIERETSHDYFALAVTIFMLLMEGVHPFEGLWQGAGSSPILETNIRDGRFAFKKGGVLSPLPAAPAFEILPPVLRTLFERCFIDGHRDPSVRPSAWDWHHALKQSEHQIQNCGSNSQHLYSGHLDRCPWCVRTSAKVNTTPASGNATPGDWRLKSSTTTDGRAASSFLLNRQDPLVGRWMSPANTRLGVDFLIIIIIGLIAAAGTLYAITGWNSAGSPASMTDSASAAARSWWSAGVEKLNLPEWKIPDLSVQANAAVEFQSLVLCQDVDRLQRPVGAGSSFSQADIRDHGLGAYVKYSAPRGAKADVSIKWSSRAGSGSSGPHPLPAVGPFFVRLGQDFPPGAYNFSLVVDGVSIQSERVTIR